MHKKNKNAEKINKFTHKYDIHRYFGLDCPLAIDVHDSHLIRSHKTPITN